MGKTPNIFWQGLAIFDAWTQGTDAIGGFQTSAGVTPVTVSASSAEKTEWSLLFDKAFHNLVKSETFNQKMRHRINTRRGVRFGEIYQK